MTVSELIERLQECDPDAEVRIMSQENWPFENSILGVTVREEMQDDARECGHEPHEEGCPALDEENDDGLQPNDVFIVEGQQERYGSKRAWAVCS